jgi:hypothetical protein
MLETINPTELRAIERMRTAVNAYLNPHPLDHDSHWEDDFFTGIPGFLNERDEEEGTYAYLREENIELYERIERQASEWLQSSMVRLWPLLKDHHFRSVNLMVDLFGFILENGSVAGYNPEYSRPAKGVYSFVLSRPLTLRMMKHREEGTEMDPHDEHTLVHEVIHMLDHWDLLKPSLLADSDDPATNLRYCILNFRSEGVAELYHLLHGRYDVVDSIETARLQASGYLKAVRDRLQSMGRTDEKTRREVFKQHIHYSVGPWLILDLLRSFHVDENLEMIENCLATISRKEPVAHDRILEVMKLALMVNCQWFLQYAERELMG